MGIFVNRTLNMKAIAAIGFDMDHTLVRYHTQAFEEMVFKTVVDKLINEKGYPKNISKIPFEMDRALKGLVLDKIRGNVLKLSLHGRVKSAYHGLEEIDYRKRSKIYRGMVIDLSDPNFLPMDTAFSISHTSLFSSLVDFKDKNSHALPDYEEISSDILEMVDLAHRDDSLKSQVRENPKKYIMQDAKIPKTLEVYKKSGKRLWLITNSDFGYTKAIMEFAFDPFLKDHSSWRDLFEIGITFASKPSFFTSSRSFLEVNPETGTMTNISGRLEKGKIYQGGSAERLEQDMELEGEKILYIGDHIFGDVVALKKSCHWRTALVLEDIETELGSLQKASDYARKIETLMEEKEVFQNDLDHLYLEELANGTPLDQGKLEEIRDKIDELDGRISPLIKNYDSCFNPYWGELMRAGYEESRFADQIKKYACIYMGTIGDLLEHSPRMYYRERRRLLAHEAKLSKDALNTF